MYVLSKISLTKKQTENWAITKDKRRINTDTAQYKEDEYKNSPYQNVSTSTPNFIAKQKKN